MANFASHSGLSEQTKWSKWDVKPGEVGPAGAGDNSDIRQHGVRGEGLESGSHHALVLGTLLSGPCVTSRGVPLAPL